MAARFVFLVLTLLLLRGSMSAPAPYAPSESGSYLEYITVAGYFLQDEADTDPKTFQYNTTSLGLIDRAYDSDAEFDPHGEKTQWQRFEHHVTTLNKGAESDVQYKMLYMGRHGEGYHNVAEAFYGTEQWDCYWSLQDGDTRNPWSGESGVTTWADPNITAKGEVQARIAHEFWKKEIAEQKIPVPEKYYSSPLERCLITADITFSNLELPPDRPFVPEVKELLREAIGIHTCDRRSPKTEIQSRHPGFTFEPRFAEKDQLWRANWRETDVALDARMQFLVDDVVSHDHSTYISFTSHSGAISSLLRVLGHRPFSLTTGAVIPVLLKIRTVTGAPPTPTASQGPPYTTAPTCSSGILLPTADTQTATPAAPTAAPTAAQ
ncbi:MAG: hypothetical protein M1832_006372 [Thelocarpon impressellum]|nr:MAG: hypothetical protein M1832_006372 [Thelocarpon impressellum]